MIAKLKGLLRSKTFWTNLVMAIVGVITEGLSTVGLDPAIYAGIVGAVNLGLRFLTNKSLEDKVA